MFQTGNRAFNYILNVNLISYRMMRLKNNILKISYVAIVLAFVALEARSSFEIDALFLVNHLNGLIERNLIYFNASLYIFLITIICSNFKFSEESR
jgi:hypothetical protein